MDAAHSDLMTENSGAGDQIDKEGSKTSLPLNFEQKLSSEFDKAANQNLNGTMEDGHHSSSESSKRQVLDDSQVEDSSGTPSVQQTGVDTECQESDATAAKEIEESPELADAGDDGWMDILGSGQLKKKVLKAGRKSTRPAQGSLVTVKVTGQLDNNDCVLISTESFILGDGDVIAAIDMGVALMEQEEVAEVFTVARFAYGSKGREPDIPKDSSLTLTLELLEVQPGVDFSKLSLEERLQFGERKRERGNDLFGRDDYSGAINSYSKAVKFLDSSSGGLSGDKSLLQKLLDSRLKCYNNMAASQLKIGATDAAVRSCEEVLGSQPENIKALYRLGKAYSAKGQSDKAICFLKKAIKLDPESKMLHRELASLSQKQKKESESEKNMYKKMMGSMADAAQDLKSGSKESGSSMLKWSLMVGGVVAAAASMGLAFYRSSH